MDAVAQSQNALMSQLKDLISNEMGMVQDQQQKYGTYDELSYESSILY
jgi:hypothetical protein